MVRKLDHEKHAQKRAEILAAASRCFGRDGFRGASVGKICAEAKISPGHLYHYFTNKEAIVAAIAHDRLNGATAAFAQALRRTNVVVAVSETVAKVAGNQSTEDRSLILDLIAEASRNPDISRLLVEHTKATALHLAGALREAQVRGEVDADLDPETVASFLMSLIDGFRTMAVRNPTGSKARNVEMFGLLIRRYLQPWSDNGRTPM